MAPVVLTAVSNLRLPAVSVTARALPTASVATAGPSVVAAPISGSRTTRPASPTRHAAASNRVFAPDAEERVLTAAVLHEGSAGWQPVVEPEAVDACGIAQTPAADLEQPPIPQEEPAQHRPALSHTEVASTASYALQKDQNSVTIKAETSVKDAAGAIVKVLDRLCSTLVTALQCEAGFDALNRACKALAVCRKYLTDSQPGLELSFLPVNRSDAWGREDPSLFSFLAFKSCLQRGVELGRVGEGQGAPDLHVSASSDPSVLAHMIVRAMKEQGQAVMKAGGGCALFVAMTAVVQARHMLKALHAMDVLLVPQWITEDTRASLGRESKFLQFTVLPAGLHGVMPAAEGAMRPPAVVPVPMGA